MSNTTIPVAPKMPIFGVLRRWKDPNLWSEGDMHVTVFDAHTSMENILESEIFILLPYVDLPNEILKKRGMACLTSDGKRGWVTWDVAIDALFSSPVEPKECPDFLSLLEDNNWEITILRCDEVDMKRHCRLRSDDGAYDMTGPSLWEGGSCEWCGHPVLDITIKCEACNAVPKIEAGVVEISGSFSFGEEFQ